jgi:cytochrome c
LIRKLWRNHLFSLKIASDFRIKTICAHDSAYQEEKLTMKMRLFAAIAAILAALFAMPGFASASDGAKVWKKCRACHTYDGKNKTGPTLQGLFARAPGSQEKYKYSKGFKKWIEVKAPTEWTDEALDQYLSDPGAFLSAAVGKKTRGKMSYKLKKAAERAAIIRFLREKTAQ